MEEDLQTRFYIFLVFTALSICLMKKLYKFFSICRLSLVIKMAKNVFLSECWGDFPEVNEKYRRRGGLRLQISWRNFTRGGVLPSANSVVWLIERERERESCLYLLTAPLPSLTVQPWYFTCVTSLIIRLRVRNRTVFHVTVNAILTVPPCTGKKTDSEFS